MNGNSVVLGQLVQRLELITPNTSTLQDDQNEWSLYYLDSWFKSLDIWDIINWASVGQGLITVHQYPMAYPPTLIFGNQKSGHCHHCSNPSYVTDQMF